MRYKSKYQIISFVFKIYIGISLKLEKVQIFRAHIDFITLIFIFILIKNHKYKFGIQEDLNSQGPQILTFR